MNELGVLCCLNYNVDNMDPLKIVREVESFLQLHTNASLAHTADRLAFSVQDIEQALREVHHFSYPEFQQYVKLNEAFRQLGESRILPEGSWEETRYHPRTVIPRTTVRYKIRSLWKRGRSFSNPHPMVDLSRGGLAMLSDVSLAQGKRVSLLLRFPDRNDELRLEGRIVYGVATGIAGFRYRIGIQFMPFAHRRGCNDLKTLDWIEQRTMGPNTPA